MVPEPVTPPEADFDRRAQRVFDLERTLAEFLNRLLA
jgi:hypothetical protein